MPKILIIHDDEHAARIMEIILQTMPGGYEVTVLLDPARSLETIETTEPNLIFAAQLMRPISATKLISEMNAVPKLQHIPVVVCCPFHADVQAQQRKGATDAMSEHYDNDRIGTIERMARQYAA